MSEKRLDEEKCEATETQIEYYESAHSNDERLTAFTPEEQKKIIRRIDIRLVITLGVLYCVSLIDRGNLSAAVIAGSFYPPSLSYIQCHSTDFSPE